MLHHCGRKNSTGRGTAAAARRACWGLLALAWVAWTPAAHAAAPWQWVDESGRKVYSDLPPPPQLPAKNILKQPGRVAPAPLPVAAEPENPPAAPPPKTPPAKAADPAADQKRLEAERAEAAQRKAQEDKNAAIRADNCRRAQQSLATLQTGARLTTTNAQGEAVVMDENQREQEARRLRQVMADNCY